MAKESRHFVLVRGLIREAAHWGHFPKLLQEAYPESRLDFLDLPGNGKFFRETTPVSIDKMVDHLREQLNTLREPSKKVSAISISLGSMVTARWAGRHPEDFESAVLINTSLRGVSPFYSRISPYAYAKLIRIVLSRTIREREDRILELTTKAVREPQLLQSRIDVQKEHPFRKSNALRQILAAAIHPKIKKPSIPILLLNSLGDQLVHPDCSDAIRRRWQVPMKRHAWAGHDLPVDDPSWTLDAIRAWYEERRATTLAEPSDLASRDRGFRG